MNKRTFIKTLVGTVAAIFAGKKLATDQQLVKVSAIPPGKDGQVMKLDGERYVWADSAPGYDHSTMTVWGTDQDGKPIVESVKFIESTRPYNG